MRANVLFTASALLLIAIPSVSSAGTAEICYSPAQAFNAATPPDNNTVFACPIAGNKTLPQLAAEGWSIVQLTPIVVGGTSQTQQLIIQKR
jgi:hypothetical protein